MVVVANYRVGTADDGYGDPHPAICRVTVNSPAGLTLVAAGLAPAGSLKRWRCTELNAAARSASGYPLQLPQPVRPGQSVNLELLVDEWNGRRDEPCVAWVEVSSGHRYFSPAMPSLLPKQVTPLRLDEDTGEMIGGDPWPDDP